MAGTGEAIRIATSAVEIEGGHLRFAANTLLTNLLARADNRQHEGPPRMGEIPAGAGRQRMSHDATSQADSNQLF